VLMEVKTSNVILQKKKNESGSQKYEA